MGKIVCFVNRKGGSGKTTTVFNLAGALVEMGHRVLVIDMDYQGSFSRSLRIYPDDVRLSALLASPNKGFRDLIHPTPFEGLSVIPSDPGLRAFEFRFGHEIRSRSALKQCMNRYLPYDEFDFVFIDCPPNLALLTSNALVAAEETIIPFDGSTYTTDALIDTMESIRLVQKSVNRGLHLCGILLSNVNLRTVFDRGEILRERFGDLLFETVIPKSIRVNEAVQMGKPITFYARTHPLAYKYRELARELVKRLEKSDKGDRLRAVQLAPLGAPAAPAEAEKAPPKRKKRSQEAVPPRQQPAASKEGGRKRGPSGAMRGGGRLAFRVAQQAQLEVLPTLGEADEALVLPSRRRKAREREADTPRTLREKAGFQSLPLAQLDTGPVVAEVERELLSLPKERGPLSALSTALARLRVLLTGDGRKARRREAQPEAVAVGMAAEPTVDQAVAPVKEGLEAPVIEEEPEVEYPAVVVEPEEVEIVTPAATILREMPRPYREIITLTAALEDLGANKDDGFGFVLRFGSAAKDEERKSEFEVTGTGLAELSKHLVKWFGEARDIEEIPLQVVDEGNGQLKIFISGEKGK